MKKIFFDKLVIVRGGGDLATGIIQKIFRAGFPVVVLEKKDPSAIRRKVALSEAFYDGEVQVEDLRCRFVGSADGIVDDSSKQEKLRLLIDKTLGENVIPLVEDEEGKLIEILKPFALVDAIIAKKNLGTRMEMAACTIGVGPGFEAGKDVHVVVETKRGHDLGRLIYKGSAIPNTGIPGMIGGYAKARVIHANNAGVIRKAAEISDLVQAGQVIAYIEDGEKRYPVVTQIAGVLRGIIRDGYPVVKGFKIADVDPRIEEKENCFTISDKARAIGGGVLEALLASQL